MEPRAAATVILARPAERGPEVVILTRGRSSRFLPGYAVFPGGTVEVSDRDLAEALFGDPSEACRACAVRELYEEAAILLTRDGPVTRLPDRAIEEVGFEPPAAGELIEVARWIAPEFLDTRFDAVFFAARGPSGVEPPAAGELVEVARWIAPEFLDTRFDAVFFAARGPSGVEPVADDAEISAARWARPADVVDAVERGDERAFWPTLVMLRALAGCRDVEDVLGLRVEQIPDPQRTG